MSSLALQDLQEPDESERTAGARASRGGHRSERPRPAVRLLDTDPDLGSALTPADRETAARLLVLPVLSVPRGRWEVPDAPSWVTPGTALLILGGVLVRNATLGNRTASQLLGPGDVFDPWSPAEELLPCEITWHTEVPTELAVLDARYAAVARRWPAIAGAVQLRLAERADRLAAQAAALQLSSVDQRVVAVLWQLADRFGRVGAGGVVIPLPLSHQMIGRLVGAQRPTVTLALGKLGQSGDVVRRPDGSWFVSSGSRELVAPARDAG